MRQWLMASLILLASQAASAQSLPPPPDYPQAISRSSYHASSSDERGGPLPGQQGLDSGHHPRWLAQRGRQGQRGKKGQRLRALFARFDVNHKGHLDQAEQRKAIASILASPRVRQRLAQNPQKASQVRSRLARFAARWHAGRGRSQAAAGEETDMGLFG